MASKTLRVTHAEVQGLRELRADLRKLDKAMEDPQAVPELKAAGHRVASMVAAEAAARAPVKSGKLRRSIKAGNVVKGAEFHGGGARIPYFFVQEFGGSVPRKGSKGSRLSARQTRGRAGMVSGGKLRRSRGAQFRNRGWSGYDPDFWESDAWRTEYAQRVKDSGRVEIKAWKKSGYFMYPALRATYPRAVQMYGEGLDRIIDKYFSGRGYAVAG